MSEPWIGHSPEHGWVLLDRSDPSNKVGSIKITFYRIPEWKPFKVKRAEWTEPRFVFYPKHLKTLIGDEARKAERLIEDAKEQLEVRERKRVARERAALREKKIGNRERIIALHKRNMEEGRWPYRGASVGIQARSANCWNCGSKDITLASDVACGRCSWIACPACGSCGCGFDSRYE